MELLDLLIGSETDPTTANPIGSHQSAKWAEFLKSTSKVFLSQDKSQNDTSEDLFLINLIMLKCNRRCRPLSQFRWRGGSRPCRSITWDACNCRYFLKIGMDPKQWQINNQRKKCRVAAIGMLQRSTRSPSKLLMPAWLWLQEIALKISTKKINQYKSNRSKVKAKAGNQFYSIACLMRVGLNLAWR